MRTPMADPAPGAIAPAARMIARTTVEDVEAMARRMGGRVTTPRRS